MTPYGITRVTTNGQTIYTHEVDRSHVLVAPYVAAEMTDLLQTAVNTGTGRAAQIGRPVAGKTGTTTSTKDGWFLGFSSGLTTGVWMGRDDAKPVGGLHGGAAPAQAFAAMMKPATADRPIEQFDTQVVLPDWQMGNEEDAYFGQPDDGMQVDPDGNPVPPPPAVHRPAGTEEGGDQVQSLIDGASPDPAFSPRPGQELNQAWIDHVTGRDDGQPRRDAPVRALPPTRPVQDDRPNQ